MVEYAGHTGMDMNDTDWLGKSALDYAAVVLRYQEYWSDMWWVLIRRWMND